MPVRNCGVLIVPSSAPEVPRVGSVAIVARLDGSGRRLAANGTGDALPGVGAVRGGMIWAETVRLHRVAAVAAPGCAGAEHRAALAPLPGQPGDQRRATLWWPLLPHLLGRWAGQEVVLVFDPTPHRGDWTVLWVGIVVHRRVLPLSWRAGTAAGPVAQTLETLLPALLEPIAAALPRRLQGHAPGRPRGGRTHPHRCRPGSAAGTWSCA